MGYLERTLADGERVILRAHLHWIIFLGPAFLVLLALAVVTLSLTLIPAEAPARQYGPKVVLALLGLAAIGTVRALVNFLATDIAVTTRRFIVKRGLIRRVVMEINAGQLESVIINQSIFGRLFSYGTVIVGGTGSGIDPVKNVAEPLDLRNAANRIGRGFQHEQEPQDDTGPAGGGTAVVIGDGAFAFPVVGEAHHQVTLEYLAGGRTPDGAKQRCAALITPQPDNPYDPGAVAVRIRGEEVGFLARDVAPLFRRALRAGGYGRAACEAVIVGGWDRGPSNRGSFGVRLNARLPFRLQSAEEWARGH